MNGIAHLIEAHLFDQVMSLMIEDNDMFCASGCAASAWLQCGVPQQRDQGLVR